MEAALRTDLLLTDTDRPDPCRTVPPPPPRHLCLCRSSVTSKCLDPTGLLGPLRWSGGQIEAGGRDQSLDSWAWPGVGDGGVAGAR